MRTPPYILRELKTACGIFRVVVGINETVDVEIRVGVDALGSSRWTRYPTDDLVTTLIQCWMQDRKDMGYE